jgi:hypothetical protein
MNTEAEIPQAFLDFGTGRFGHDRTPLYRGSVVSGCGVACRGRPRGKRGRVFQGAVFFEADDQVID